MNKLIIYTLISFVLFAFYNNTYAQNSDAISTSLQGNFKVLEIMKLKKAFLITLIRISDSTYYDVVSPKIKTKCKYKIEYDTIYNFKLDPIYEYPSFPDLGVLNVVLIDGKKVKVPRHTWTWNVYRISNLQGLCLEKLK